MKIQQGISTGFEEAGNGFSEGFSFNLKREEHCELKDAG